MLICFGNNQVKLYNTNVKQKQFKQWKRIPQD